MNTLHKELFDFDFQNGVYYMNVGEGNSDTRCWEDCRDYGFMAAGQDWDSWGKKLHVLKVGDVICAYIAGHGYTGIGIVTEKAIPASDFKFKGKPLGSYKLKQPNVYLSNAGTKDCDFLVKVNWKKTIPKEQAVKVGRNAFTTALIVASLENQPKTLKYLENQFGVSFKRLISRGG